VAYAVKYGAGSNRLFQFPFVVLDLAGIRRPVVQIRALENNDLLLQPPGVAGEQTSLFFFIILKSRVE